MIQKPAQYAPSAAEAFEDLSVAEAYQHRPPYPKETFDILMNLVGSAPTSILDVGCGTDKLARPLAPLAGRVDAVDASLAMIEQGKQKPGGNHPNLRWIHSKIEDAMLEPPYSLITAGASLHWLDWNFVFPLFHELLVPDGYLAIVTANTYPGPWGLLSEAIDEYRTDGGYQPFNVLDELENHGLFNKVGQKTTKPVKFSQAVDAFIESYHSRSMFSKDRMGTDRAVEFKRAAQNELQQKYPRGMIEFDLTVDIVWGVPLSTI